MIVLLSKATTSVFGTAGDHSEPFVVVVQRDRAFGEPAFERLDRCIPSFASPGVIGTAGESHNPKGDGAQLKAHQTVIGVMIYLHVFAAQLFRRCLA